MRRRADARTAGLQVLGMLFGTPKFGGYPPLAGNAPPFAEKGETSSTLPPNLAPWNVPHTWREIRT